MTEDFYIQLIYKQLDKNISGEEERQLSDWLAEDVDHQNTYDAIRLAWDTTGEAEVPDVSLQDEFAKLETQMEAEDGKVVPMRWPRRLALAAGFALLLLAGYWLSEQILPSNAVQYAEVQTGEETRKVILPDNSVIHLEENSYIKYPVEFDEKNRPVELKGKAFFEVAKDLQRPFSVMTKEVSVTVLGTSFLVDSRRMGVQVATGKVRLQRNSSEKFLDLTAGQRGAYNPGKNKLEMGPPNISENNLVKYTNKWIFKNQSVQEILLELNKYYNINFKVENPKLKTCTFTSSFGVEDLEEILETMSGVLGFEVVKTAGKNYVLRGGSCE